MYINNITGQNNNIEITKSKITTGSTIYGKIISEKDNIAIIKLIDGTIIPAVFVSENSFEIQKNKFMKFYVSKFNNNIFELKLEAEKSNSGFDSIEKAAQELNIPREDVLSIVNSLIKFNLPISNENIFKLYKNLSFINTIKNFSSEDILSFIKKNINGNITYDDKFFESAEQILNNLKDIDVDFLSFLLENNIPQDVDGSLEVKNFIQSNFLINTLISQLINPNTKPSENITFYDLKNLANQVRSHSSEDISSEVLNELLKHLDLLKQLDSNYNYYFFNTYFYGQEFKNNLILKKSYKNSNYIDTNNIRLLLLIETSKLGNIEGYISKLSNKISVTLKVEKSYLSFFKSNLNLLENAFKSKGYDSINLSVEKKNQSTNIISASSFFNTFIFKKLDVKI